MLSRGLRGGLGVLRFEEGDADMYVPEFVIAWGNYCLPLMIRTADMRVVINVSLVNALEIDEHRLWYDLRGCSDLCL
jgi:hypothetical protein